MPSLTDSELITVGLTAAHICGCLWDGVDAVGTVAKLQAVLAMTQPRGDADLTRYDIAAPTVLLSATDEAVYMLAANLTRYDIEALRVLLSATDEAVYMLADADTNGDLRDATIAELCDSLLSGPEGIIEVDGKRCYVDTALSY